MKAGGVRLICAAAIAAVIVAGVYWTGQVRRGRLLAESVPARPDLAGWPGELAQRVDAAEARLAADAAPGALGALGGLYHANGFLPEAAQCYQGLAALEPDEPRWPHRLAHILAGYGRVGEAIPLWRRTLELAPDYMPARLRLGDALLKDNQTDEAASIYAAALAREPQNAYALLGMARADLERGQFEAARTSLEAAVRISDFKLGYDLLPTAYERLGMRAQADSIRGRAKASGAFRDPPDPWIDEVAPDCYDVYRLLLIAGAAGFAGRTAEAFSLLERAVQLAPESPVVHYQLGILAMNTREYSRARRHLEKAVVLSPELADAWGALAHLAGIVGDGPTAERTLAEGLEHCPGSAGLFLNRGRRRASEGRYDEAIADLETAVRLRVQDPDACLELARLLIKLGRTSDGVARFREALEIEPGNPLALTTIALHAISLGDESEALRCIHMIRIQPRVDGEDARQIEAAFVRNFGRRPD